jgi:hypothetical protein
MLMTSGGKREQEKLDKFTLAYRPSKKLRDNQVAPRLIEHIRANTGHG